MDEGGAPSPSATASHTDAASSAALASPNVTRVAAPPASSSASPAGTTASAPAGWWAKISSFAAR